MQSKKLELRACSQCGVTHARNAWKSHSYSKGLGFCSRECWWEHEHQCRPNQSGVGGRPRARRDTAAYRAYIYKSPKKTIEEDLAWMYDENPGLLLSDDKRKSGRRTGGAGSRHAPHARLLK